MAAFKSERPAALLALTLVMIVWGGTFVVTKAAAAEIPPLTLATLRFLIALVVLLPIAWSRGGLKHLPRPVPWGALVLTALSGIALFTIAFNYALFYASATQGALIYALLPAAIAVAAVFFLKERPTRRRLGGIALSIVGVALVVAAGEAGGNSPQPFVGALWMIGAVVAWTAYTVFAKKLAAADQLIITTAISLLGVLMLAPLAGIELMYRPWQSPSLQAWLGMLFLGVVASALAYIAYNFALRILDASLVGVFTNLDPIIGVVTAVLFLGESLHGGQVVGGALALLGMWLASSESASVETPSPTHTEGS